MESVKTLIVKAAGLCGSYAELGRRVGVSASRVSDWRHGTRCPTPEQVACLCQITQESGEVARALACESIIGNPKNASRADELRRALFGCWVATVGAALIAYSTPTEATTTTQAEASRLSQYTLWNVAVGRFRRAWRVLQSLAHGIAPRVVG